MAVYMYIYVLNPGTIVRSKLQRELRERYSKIGKIWLASVVYMEPPDIPHS